MTDLRPEIEQLRAYRDRLRKAGRLLEARAVGYCLEILKPTPGLNPAHALPQALGESGPKVGKNVGNMAG